MMYKKSLCFLLVLLLMLVMCSLQGAALIRTAEQPALGIILSSEEEYMLIGDSLTLTATVLPADESNQTIIWTTDQATVAVVSDSGDVSAVGTGYATITAATEDGAYSASCQISVNTPYSVRITWPGSEAHMYVGYPDLCLAEVLPASTPNREVYWSSSDPSVLSVGFGMITALSPGTVTLTATTAVGGLTDTCTVYVYDFAQSVSLNVNALQMCIGDIQRLTATVMPYGSKQKVSWHSDDESVVTVDENGDVTGVGLGTAVVTVTAQDGGFTDTCVVTVAERQVSGVSLSSHYKVIFIDDALTLTAVVEPEDAADKRVEWSSDNIDVAQVEPNGHVTGISEGHANITVTTKNGDYTDVCHIEVVRRPVFWVHLNTHQEKINIGSTLMLTAVIEPENATDKRVEWTSDNTDVAQVDQNGLVTGISEGHANITVTPLDGVTSDTCHIEVVNSYVTGVYLSSFQETMSIGETLTLIATVEPEHALDKSILWTCQNPQVATVDQNGTVTAHNAGLTMVIVTTNCGGLMNACFILVTNTQATGVRLDTSEKAMHIGDTVSLAATVEPQDAGDKRVNWLSSNEAVAEVDQSGMVTAVSPGTAVITVTTLEGGHTDTCLITVTDCESLVICSDRYTIERTAGFIKGIKIGATVSDIKANLYPEGQIEVYCGDDIYTGDKLASGMTIRLVVDGDVKDTLVIVMAGDLNGDGTINISDITNMRLDILQLKVLTGFRREAADVNNDGFVDISDYTLMRLDILDLKKIHE